MVHNHRASCLVSSSSRQSFSAVQRVLLSDPKALVGIALPLSTCNWMWQVAFEGSSRQTNAPSQTFVCMCDLHQGILFHE